MSDEVQDSVDGNQPIDDEEVLNNDNQNDKKDKKDKKKRDKEKKKNRTRKKSKPSYFTEKVLSEPKFQRQEAMNYLLGLDNKELISRSACITYIGTRRRYIPKKILIGKRSPNANNNNWKLFHSGKPLFKGHECKLPIKDPDFIRLALSQPSLFKVSFVTENPLQSKEAHTLYQAPKESQLNLKYRVKLDRLRSGNKTAVTVDEAHLAMKDIGKLGPFRKGMDLKHIMSFLQAIIEKDANEKKKNTK